MCLSELGQFKEACRACKRGSASPRTRRSGASTRPAAPARLRRARAGRQGGGGGAPADAPLPGRSGDPVPQRAPHRELRLPADDEARQVAPASVWMHQAAGEANESQGTTTRRSRSTGRCSPSRRDVPGSTPPRSHRTWRARVRPSRRPMPRPCRTRVRAGAPRSIPRTPTRPTSSERSRARPESSTRRASCSRAPSSTIRTSRRRWSAWAGSRRARARPEQALPPLKKAVALNPQDDVAYFQIYQAHRRSRPRRGGRRRRRSSSGCETSKRESGARDLLVPREVTQQELDPKPTPP